MYVDVAVCLPLIRTFVYELPEPIEIGCRVVVPFRRRKVEGFVVGIRKEAPNGFQVHAIEKVIDHEPLVQPDIFELCRWIAGYYIAPLGEALKAALPPGITAKHVANLRPSPGASRHPLPGGEGPPKGQVRVAGSQRVWP